MKVAFFTEGGYSGKVPRQHPNMRTELAWMVAMDADHYNIHNNDLQQYYDLGICIIPKKNPEFNLDKIKTKCSRVAAMQEGPHWYFQDYPLDQQIWYFNTLQEMDFLFVHNEIDKQYFEGLTNLTCKVLPSLMIEDSVNNLPDVKRSCVMIGGNFCNWYGGFDSYMVAQEFENDIYIPSMGRRIDGEEQLPGLNHLPYMNWINWIQELNKRRYAVHMMRTHAAGTFALNCAYLGIPCIGYKGLDTQEICHPDCTVEIGDIPAAKQIARKLRKDEEFYLYCSNIAKKKYKEHFHEDRFNTIIQSLYE